MRQRISRRAALGLGLMLPTLARAGGPPKQVGWDDLIPPGVPYSEIIGEGEMDVLNDLWKPVFDANGTRFNPVLEGAFIRMPGYIIPMEFSGRGVTEFIMVPYVGACIHVPPPPPNQLVYVTLEAPFASNGLWDAVWVTGTMRTETTDTHLAVIGYAMKATKIEVYRW
ncbi:MAG: DUF3299 domain-containing protein [Pseudomonadota bacterium]